MNLNIMERNDAVYIDVKKGTGSVLGFTYMGLAQDWRGKMSGVRGNPSSCTSVTRYCQSTVEFM